ncbi:ComEA family DNA-binding protein [Corynebacterium comes]|uniref:ComE operon protein 1 n=1 Tax=Corynebacterium comes TaxID=2675218 RepID=A0A6B8W5Q5_9CORY|nr:helix-hairpin-helix domain-containing protein [Corynebacterium comes]QGU05260.1 ComE operon protein 1 [Corynebacterium comes]
MSPLNRLKDLTRPTGEEELLDVAYPAPRLHLTLRHAAFAAVAVVLLVAGIVAIQAGRADTSSSPQPEFPAVTRTSTEAESGDLVVSVVGAVAGPGLVTLTPGARVHDALSHAQPLPGADLLSLNLAQRLTDGQQLVVPVVGEPAAPEAPTGGGGVSLNSASVTELTTLPGIGPATAAAIVAHRESTGGFLSIEQLLDVKGIGPAKFEALREAVTL